LNAVISSIGKGMITPQQYMVIEKFSDMQVFAEAEWFRDQIVSAFNKLYFNINEKSCGRNLSFDEVKKYLKEISELDKAKIYIYMMDLRKN